MQAKEAVMRGCPVQYWRGWLALSVVLVLSWSLLAAGGSRTATAAALAAPAGPGILTVSGAISTTNAAGGKAQFDRAMLEGLGLEKLRTSTPWTDGVVEFEGVRMARLLDTVGAKGSSLHAVAINDYAIELDVAEMRKYPVLLAM